MRDEDLLLKESRDLLHKASMEIIALRKQNEILGAQVAVIEVFAAALGLRKNQGVSIDVAWEMQKHVTAIDNHMKGNSK